VLVAWLK